MEDEIKGKISSKRVIFRVTQAEDEYLANLSKIAGLNESNFIRKAIKRMAEELGVELPEGVFSDKPGGNWTPKPRGKDLPAIVVNAAGRHNTAVGAGTPTAALIS